LKVALLTDGNTRIELAAHGSREVADSLYLVLRIEESACESLKIQPLVLCFSKCPVVEIETVDVDISPLHNLT